MMDRKALEKQLKNNIRILAIQTRAELNLTQRKMADRLHMSESCYSDIETGRSGGSTLTFLLLLEMQDKAEECLHSFSAELRRIDEAEW